MRILHVLLCIASAVSRHKTAECPIPRPYIRLFPYVASNMCWFNRIKYPVCETLVDRLMLCPEGQHGKIYISSHRTQIAREKKWYLSTSEYFQKNTEEKRLNLKILLRMCHSVNHLQKIQLIFHAAYTITTV
jgi:hypothetical protein